MSTHDTSVSLAEMLEQAQADSLYAMKEILEAADINYSYTPSIGHLIVRGAAGKLLHMHTVGWPVFIEWVRSNVGIAQCKAATQPQTTISLHPQKDNT